MCDPKRIEQCGCLRFHDIFIAMWAVLVYVFERWVKSALPWIVVALAFSLYFLYGDEAHKVLFGAAPFWHVLINCDRPDPATETLFRRLYHTLLEHDSSKFKNPGGFDVSWPIQRGPGGEHHFILVLCDDRDLDTLKKVTNKVFGVKIWKEVA